MNEDIAPYVCLYCKNRVGLSWIEPKHNCNEPLFNYLGEITNKFKSLYGNRV